MYSNYRLNQTNIKICKNKTNFLDFKKYYKHTYLSIAFNKANTNY